MNAPEELLSIATRVAHEAGAHVLHLIANDTPRADLRAQAGRKSTRTDLVSDADRESEKVIVRRLGELRPHDGVLGEEGARKASRSGVDWIIDPVDGTVNFLYGFASFAISIAAYEKGTALCGVVYDPLRDETYRAASGIGAFCNEHRLEHDGRQAQLAEALVGTGFGYASSRRRAQSELLPTILPQVRDIRRQGAAALDLCYVAAGKLDAYYEAGLQPWDRAAGLVVAAEAGCTQFELDLGHDLESTLVVCRPELERPLGDLLLRAAATRQSLCG